MATEATAPRRKLSAILMVDVSGFSRMMGRDEERTTALIREFHGRTKGLVEAHLVLAAVFTFWRSETPWWWLLLGGVVVLAVGLAKLRTAVVPRSIR